MKTLLIIALIAAFGYMVLGGGGKVNAAALTEALNDQSRLLLDVRTPGEFKAGGLPGARNVPLGQTAKMAKIIGRKDRAVVVYCRSGARSSQAVKALQAQGFTRVVNGGGMGRLSMKLSATPTQS